MKDLEAWSGKLVAIQGKVGLQEEGIAAVSTEVRCPVVPVTDGERWPASIDLVNGPLSESNAGSGRLGDPRSVRVLKSIVAAILREYSPYSPPQEPFKITATFVGTLRTAKLDSIGGSGFGFGAMMPAQLDYIAVRDIVVTQLNPPPSAPAP
jgi:hypothetical protein